MPITSALTQRLALLLLLPAFANAEMLPVDDAALEQVTGQSGISLALEFDLNVQDADQDGVVDLTGGNFQPIANCGNGTFDNGTAGSCRLAINITNRPDEWVVFKDFYGSARTDNIYLDGGYLRDAGNDTSTFDPERFKATDGSCLVDPTGNDCGSAGSPPAYFDDLAAMVVSMPGKHNGTGFTARGYDSTTGVSSGYDSLELGLTIGGIAVEYGPTGYEQNLNGSFLGVNIADNNSPYAGIDVQGQAYIFGF